MRYPMSQVRLRAISWLPPCSACPAAVGVEGAVAGRRVPDASAQSGVSSRSQCLSQLGQCPS